MRQVCVNRQAVLDYIKNSQGNLDTYQIAEALSTPERLIPERSVRAAVTWLILANFLERSATPSLRKTIAVEGKPSQTYKVWLYKFTGKNAPISRVRHDPDERKAQEWNIRNNSGVFLQNLFSKLGKDNERKIEVSNDGDDSDGIKYSSGLRKK